MNQIAGVDGFSLMNNLRLVVIVAIFIILIIVLFYNRILGSPKRAKQKDKQVVNPSDDSGREEQHATDVVGDFFGKEESKEKEKSKVDESTAEPEVEIEGRPSDDSSHEERDVPGAAGDFFGIEEFTEKEISKGGESTAESEVVIEDQPAVNYEKIETDLKAVGDEVTTKIEGLISKVEAVEKELLNKIEDVIDAKIQEASNKINDRISEAVRTQMNSINSISEERVDSLRKDEVPGEIKEKEQADTIAPSGGIEERKERDLKAPVKDSDIMEKVHLFVRYQLDAFDILPLDEAKTVAEVKKDVKVDEKKLIESSDILEKLRLFVMNRLGAIGILSSGESKTVVEEKKERDLEVPSEVKKDVKVEENEPIEAITSTWKVEEKISAGDVGGSVDLDIANFLEEEPVGMSFTEEPKELAEEKAEFEEKKESDLEAPVEDSDILEKLAGSLQKNEDPFGVLPFDKSKTVTEDKNDVKVDEKEPIEAIAPPGDIKENATEAAKGEEAEEKKQSTGETADFDIQDFLEELGAPPSEKE